MGASWWRFPLDDGLRVRPGRDDPQLIGPDRWDAASVPKLYIRAAYRTGPGKGKVFWSTLAEQGFSAERRVEFAIQPDVKPHTYEVNLASCPKYQGTITRLRFDPALFSGSEGDEVEGSNSSPGTSDESPVLRVLSSSASLPCHENSERDEPMIQTILDACRYVLEDQGEAQSSYWLCFTRRWR